ncbi:alpha/beta-hydrolase [Gymnopus androsaceus JB14]|uniref:carboxypeptidase C n=1 Tax=Gymnopus androsaceus JB14 TaxID=1447944 RepID=A0A6A4HY44_9AGAR|nr:alpha/beta-hydrolase [Gymnopus androsaceus JB14]
MNIKSFGISVLISGIIASQVPLTPVNTSTGGIWNSEANSEFFTPLETLSNVKDSEFAVLGHPFFPKHGVRIKRSNFCDPTVDMQRLALDILIFKPGISSSTSSRGLRARIVEVNAGIGTGCSSSIGLFMELGPCRVLDESGPKSHPESWNTNANIFFINQPIGVGFSYTEYGETVSTTEEAAEDIAAFVAIFFEHFTKFKVMIDFETALPSQYDMACTPASVEPVLNISTYLGVKSGSRNRVSISTMLSIVTQERYSAKVRFGIRSMHLERGIHMTSVYPAMELSIQRFATHSISKFLSRPDVRAQLGVDVTAIFIMLLMPLSATRCTRRLRAAVFRCKGAALCNWVGNERWSKVLEWNSHDAFVSQRPGLRAVQRDLLSRLLRVPAIWFRTINPRSKAVDGWKEIVIYHDDRGTSVLETLILFLNLFSPPLKILDDPLAAAISL